MLRSSKGFTLIELLIVVVIIGILAAIAIPKFANTKEKAYVSAMKSDLRNMAAAQEAYFADELEYTTTIGNLEFNTTNDVTIAIPAAAADGWRATATHAGVPGTTCALYYGASTYSSAPATVEGVVDCT
jgi:prepilin-type N-terminal cleavage/methylation domain-containing protein